MQPEDIANLATACVLITTSIILIPLCSRAGKEKSISTSLGLGIRSLRIATLLIGVFLLLHGLYHISEYLGIDTLSDSILEPLSLGLLLSFTVFVWQRLFVPAVQSSRSNAKIKPQQEDARHSSQSREGRLGWLPYVVIAVVTALAVIGALLFDAPAEWFTFSAIIIAAGLFLYMLVRNPAVHSVHFGFVIITLVWAIAEIPHVLSSLGLISISYSFDQFGTWVHFLSMLFVGVFVSYRVVMVTFSDRKHLQLETAPHVISSTSGNQPKLPGA